MSELRQVWATLYFTHRGQVLLQEWQGSLRKTHAREQPVRPILSKLPQSCKAEQLHEVSGTRRMEHYSSLVAVE